MSSYNSSVSSSDKYESEFSEFLLKRIGSAGGKLQLQHITGHLSQLSYDVRCAIGTSKSDLLDFLKRHSNLFTINNGVVRIVDSSKCGFDSDSSSVEQLSSLPSVIENGKGVIIKIFPEFGFIKAKEPIKTVVYFKYNIFGNENIDLTSFLYIGAMVYFDAKKKMHHKDKNSKYMATRVWKVDGSDLHSDIIVTKTRKNHDTGLYDPMTLDSEGVIQKVFPNLGFIAVNGDKNNTVFFHKKCLMKYDNVVDLTQVLSQGDLVEFSAHRSTKQDAKARWEATKVWKKSGKTVQGDFVSESDCSHSNYSLKIGMSSQNKAKEMIKDQRGKLSPRCQGAVIKFGQNELADGDAALYYISESQVTDISWEFSEGDDVFFDAVKIKSAPGWKAVLVWTGKKPDVVLPTCLGDFSAFTDDETEDNYSSYMSNSSNSSVKSMSLKSECTSSKSRKPSKEKLSLNISHRKEVNEQETVGSSHYSSQSSLSSLATSKSSTRSRKHHQKNDLNFSSKSVSNWGDSPFPGEENYSANNSLSDLSTMHTKKNPSKNPDEKSQLMLEHSDSFKKKTNKKKEFNSKEDINTGEKAAPKSINNLKEACIRKFPHIKGTVTKVYSKFAEVKASELQNTVSFFWNNFYFNGLNVEELEIDDLKQVLKVGDSVYFNYFEIVDDSGSSWQKISLAWKSAKPKKAVEISPEDFIKQNNLSVSVKSEIEVNSNQEDKIVSRKFLTAVEELSSDKQIDEVSKTESCSEDEFLISDDHPKISAQQCKIQPSIDYKMMSNSIIQILRKDLFPSDSKIELNSIAEEIINIFLENTDETIGNFSQTFPSVENEIKMSCDIACAACGKTFVPKYCDIETQNSEVQTIITGEIIAQNIFADC